MNPPESPPHAGDRIILLLDIAAVGCGTDPRGELRAGNERAQQLWIAREKVSCRADVARV